MQSRRIRKELLLQNAILNQRHCINLTLLLLDTILVRLGVRDLEPLAIKGVDKPIAKF
jgi:hypothetical protein